MSPVTFDVPHKIVEISVCLALQFHLWALFQSGSNWSELIDKSKHCRTHDEIVTQNCIGILLFENTPARHFQQWSHSPLCLFLELTQQLNLQCRTPRGQKAPECPHKQKLPLSSTYQLWDQMVHHEPQPIQIGPFQQCPFQLCWLCNLPAQSKKLSDSEVF